MSQQVTIQNAGRFVLAGDAILTMVRPQRSLIGDDGEIAVDDEKRFTYRIQRAPVREGQDADPHRPWFVKVLSGPNNLRDYQYLGTIFPCKFSGGIVYRHGRKSRVGENAPSARGIAWFIRHLNRLVELRAELDKSDMFSRGDVEDAVTKVEGILNQLLYYHEGRCGACARRLTVPESIINGIGPVCAGKDGGLPVLEFIARL